MEHGEHDRLIARITPQHPLWAVYYDDDDAYLYTHPVLCITVQELDWSEIGLAKSIEVCHVRVDRENVRPFTVIDGCNCLGYSLTEHVNEEAWELEIKIYLQKGPKSWQTLLHDFEKKCGNGLDYSLTERVTEHWERISSSGPGAAADGTRQG